MSFSVEQIDHVEVFVRDIDAAIEWYTRVLGLREMVRWNPEPVMIGAGGTMLALFRADPVARPTPPAALRWHRVAWRTDRDGLTHAQEHLANLGIAFHGPVDHGSSWSIYFIDPDGHPLEITCPSG